MLIVLMVVILGIMLVQLSEKKKEKQALKQKRSKETIEIMAQMENRIAKEKKREELIEMNQNTSCGLEYAKEGEEGEIPENDDTQDYKTCYPDMYVDKISPSVNEGDEKIAYLTFDDGPSSNTLKVLEILKEKGARATFFVLGSTMTEDGEKALRKMKEQGCAIGIHTYSHKKNIIYRSVAGFLEDFHTVFQQIYEITGEKVNIFRFPWGSYNKFSKPIKEELASEMERRGFTYFDWNVTAEDSVGKPTTYSITKNVMKDIKKYSCPVILMHDASVNDITVETLPTIIDEIKALGYEFGTLDEREPCQFHY